MTTLATLEEWAALRRATLPMTSRSFPPRSKIRSLSSLPMRSSSGTKGDVAWFQAFPSNDSTSTNCYKPQEVQLWSDKALVEKVSQAGNAWGLLENATSMIYHQRVNTHREPVASLRHPNHLHHSEVRS